MPSLGRLDDLKKPESFRELTFTLAIKFGTGCSFATLASQDQWLDRQFSSLS